MNATSALKLRSNTLKIDNPITCMEAIKNGDIFTRLSMVVMGLGNMVHGQVVKGLLFLAAEVAYIAFMVTNGFYNLSMLVSLGSVERQEVWNEELQIFEYTHGDQSILLLLYGLATILVTGVMFWIWRGTLKSAYNVQLQAKAGKHIFTFSEDIKELFDSNLYRLLMTPSMFFITALTILPLIFMICMAFTNYRRSTTTWSCSTGWAWTTSAPCSTPTRSWAPPSGRCWAGRWCGPSLPPSPTTLQA